MDPLFLRNHINILVVLFHQVFLAGVAFEGGAVVFEQIEFLLFFGDFGLVMSLGFFEHPEFLGAAALGKEVVLVKEQQGGCKYRGSDKVFVA